MDASSHLGAHVHTLWVEARSTTWGRYTLTIFLYMIIFHTCFVNLINCIVNLINCRWHHVES
uniref:Uncharacterized protein n=1 Tax=Arundo donax TaxID=35708 RepID=A0A0A9G922_ARUDO